MLKRVLIYGLLALVLFLGYQWLVLYIQGEQRSYSSLYATKRVPVQVQAEKLKRHEQRQTLECVPIQVIVDNKNKEKSDPSSHTLSQNSLEELAHGHSRLGNLTDTPQGSDSDNERKYPYLLNRFRLRAPILDNQTLEFYLQADGSTTLTQTPDPSLFALGRLREFGLWVGVESLLANNQSPENQPLDQWGYSFDASYQQDLFKVGPMWSRLRIEAGWSQVIGTHAKAQIGIPIFRF